MSNRWLTGNTLNTPNEFWRVLLPSDDWVRQALLGAILQLSEPENWEKFGTVTEFQVASAFGDILDSFEPQPVISGGNYLEKISDNLPSGSNNFIDISCPTSGYSEFIVKTFGGSNTSGARLAIRFNADVTNGNYIGVNQSQVSVASRNFLIGIKVNDQESRGELRIFSPNSSIVKKSFWANSGFSNDYLSAVGYWNSTATITAIRLTSSNATVVSGFKAELWGLPS